MEISNLRLSNFQSFGPKPTNIALSEITYVLGPNGAGKTAVLEALSRLFSPLTVQRKIQLTDFHIPVSNTATEVQANEPKLWIEVDIEFPEADEDEVNPSIPPSFAHMRIDTPDGVPRIRVRLSATLALDAVIDEKIEYILEADADGEPTATAHMSRFDRGNIARSTTFRPAGIQQITFLTPQLR